MRDGAAGCCVCASARLASLTHTTRDPRSLVVPADLAALLPLNETHGRVWVGFTAATGPLFWQTHDILAWHFTSLRE